MAIDITAQNGVINMTRVQVFITIVVGISAVAFFIGESSYATCFNYVIGAGNALVAHYFLGNSK